MFLPLVLAASLLTPAPTLHVPGAEHQQLSRLADLTTVGTSVSGHTDPADWAGLTSSSLPVPRRWRASRSTATSRTAPDNTNHGWQHDSQFVVRLPDHWNGGLVVAAHRACASNTPTTAPSPTGSCPAARLRRHRQGQRRRTFYRSSAPGRVEPPPHPAHGGLEGRCRPTYGRKPSRTIATGISNGGYLVRWQLENRPDLYDGGVDWEGTLWTVAGPNLLTFLPPALRAYPAYLGGSASAHAALVAAGFPAGTEFLWDYHYRYYWDLTQRIYREELDPGFDGALEAGVPFCASGTPLCDADYSYAARRRIVGPAVAPIALTGRVKRPLMTVHGTSDVLLPISRSSDVYAAMTPDRLHRYYRVEQGTHVDGLVDAYPDRLRPLAPCHRSAFVALERWLDGVTPPRSATLARPADVATCPLSSAPALRAATTADV